MSDFPGKARVVIIGGGVVGASSLYHLAKKGWTDCVLLEKNELTAGSTWHAAGNVPNFAGSWAIMNMQRYSAEMYRTLGEDVDYPMNYHVTGSIRLENLAKTIQQNGGPDAEVNNAAVIRFTAEQAGADGITLHLREDRRHIQERDVFILKWHP